MAVYSTKLEAQLIVQACKAMNVTSVVISPGSRNAPLTISFSQNDAFTSYQIVDERCAGFFALGIAQQTQQPVALVCTSGSALLNYYPAIAEAFYSRIPLVVISADRPKHLIDVGDGQTIRQENVFANHSLFNANLIASRGDEQTIKFNTEQVTKALQTAISQKGPTHINVPFDEPLYNVIANEERVKQSFNFSEITSSKTPRNDEVDYTFFGKAWSNATKKLILVGENFPSAELQKCLDTLVEDDSVLVLTETTSNLYNDKFINSIDTLVFPMSEEQMQTFSPDILLTFGGMVVSKKIKQILRKYQPKQHWHVDALRAFNTYHCLTEHITEDPTVFFKEFVKTSQVVAERSLSYQKNWLQVFESRQEKHAHYLANTPFSDFKAFAMVNQAFPKQIQLQLGNSSIVRYSQLFAVDSSIEVFCNRGTSGIDGSTSTAIGASVASARQTVFVTGDISFFYDSNALWNAYVKPNFRVILLNNGGGGIFRVINGPKDSGAIDFFETPHNLTAQHLCSMFGFGYSVCDDEQSLETALSSFYDESEQPKLLEIKTPRTLNDEVLKAYFEDLKE